MAAERAPRQISQGKEAETNEDKKRDAREGQIDILDKLRADQLAQPAG